MDSTYIFIISKGYKDKTYGMPLFALGAKYLMGIGVVSLMTLASLFIVNFVMVPSIKQIHKKTIYNSRSSKTLFASLVISVIIWYH